MKGTMYIVYAFFGLAAFLAAGFFAAGFFAAGFLAAFLAAGFLAFLAAGFLAALGFLAAGFLAFLALGFLVLGFLALGSLAGSLKEPAPFLPAAADTNFLAASIFLRDRRTRTAALAASTLLLATMYLRMAWREEPFLSARALMAVLIIAA